MVCIHFHLFIIFVSQFHMPADLLPDAVQVLQRPSLSSILQTYGYIPGGQHNVHGPFSSTIDGPTSQREPHLVQAMLPEFSDAVLLF